MATNPLMDIAKAGWLHRQSSYMHRWKRHWFVLNKAGELRYFDNPDSYHPEERIVLRACVVEVRAGEKSKAQPPDGFGKDCLLELKMREGSHLRLCAESTDDMKAWQMAVEESRNVPTGQPPPVYPVGTNIIHPGQVLAMPGQTQYVVHNAASATGQTMVMANATPPVVYMNQSPYGGSCYYPSGVGQTLVQSSDNPSVVYMTEPRHARHCYHGRRYGLGVGPYFY